VGAIFGDEVVGFLFEFGALLEVFGVSLCRIKHGDRVASLVTHHLHGRDVRVAVAGSSARRVGGLGFD
jgi:hypothetical protein